MYRGLGALLRHLSSVLKYYKPWVMKFSRLRHVEAVLQKSPQLSFKINII